MLLSILKILPLAFLCVGSITPVTASDKLEAFEFEAKTETQASLTPQSVRQTVLEKNYAKRYFGLLHGVNYEGKEVLRIQALHNFGETQAKTKKEFKDFMPKIACKPKPESDEASIPSAVLGFLKESLPLPQESKSSIPHVEKKDQNESKDTQIKDKVIKDVGNLLTFSYIKKIEPAKFRDATHVERDIILDAIFKMAGALRTKDNSKLYDFGFWNSYFAKVPEKMKTRATAAALAALTWDIEEGISLVASAVTRSLQDLGSSGFSLMFAPLMEAKKIIKTQINDVFKKSGMEQKMFVTLMNEMNTATGEKLKNIIEAWNFVPESSKNSPGKNKVQGSPSSTNSPLISRSPSSSGSPSAKTPVRRASTLSRLFSGWGKKNSNLDEEVH